MMARAFCDNGLTGQTEVRRLSRRGDESRGTGGRPDRVRDGNGSCRQAVKALRAVEGIDRLEMTVGAGGGSEGAGSGDLDVPAGGRARIDSDAVRTGSPWLPRRGIHARPPVAVPERVRA